MSQENTAQASINAQQQRIQEEKRQQEALEAQRRAAAAKAAAEQQRQQILSQLQEQSKQIAAQKAQLSSLASLNQQIGNNIEQRLSEVARSKAEVHELKQAIQNSQKRLEKLGVYEQQVRLKMEQLIMDLSETKAQAVQSLQDWKQELEKSAQNQQYVGQLILEGRQLDDYTSDIIQKSAIFLEEIEEEDRKLSDAFLRVEETDKTYQQERLKLQFIDTNASLSTSAFVTLQALESQRYTLREVINDDALCAWFEKVDEKGNKKEILVKLSKAFHEGREWLEELDMSKGFEFDDCLDEHEELLIKMEKLGVEYIQHNPKYPLPPQRVEEKWKRNLRNQPTANQQKNKH